jgi:hypothetical protein
MMTNQMLLFPHGNLRGADVMVDCLDDNLRRLKRDLEDIDDDCLHWKVDPEANPIALILWHMSRLLDVFFNQLAIGKPANETCWFTYGWAQKTGYDPRGRGRDGWGTLNEYTLDEVYEMPRFTKDQLTVFLEQVYEEVGQYLRSIPMETMAEPAAGFDGKYTRYQVISMALMDNVRHLGEIRLIKSLWSRSQQS